MRRYGAIFTWDAIVDYLTFEFGLFFLFLFVVKITDIVLERQGPNKLQML